MDLENEYESAFEDASKDTTEEAATQSLTETGEEYSKDRDEETGSEEAGSGEEEATGEEEVTSEEEATGEEEEATGEEEETAGEEEEAAGEEEATSEEETAGEEEEADEKVKPAEKKPGGLDEEQLAAAYKRLQDEDKKSKGGEGKGEQEQQERAADDPRQKTWRDYVNEEDLKVLEPYESEWSEVSQAEQIKRDAQLQHVQDVVYSDLKSVLAPVVEFMQQSKVEAHFNAIRKEHSDFDEVKEDLNAWVEEQPEFVRPAFEQVLQQGSAQQVVDLINAYKQAKGKTGAAPEVPASSASKGEGKKPPRKEPPAGAKRALAATPSTKRKDPPRAADPDDFSSAFDEAAKSVGGI